MKSSPLLFFTWAVVLLAGSPGVLPAQFLGVPEGPGYYVRAGGVARFGLKAEIRSLAVPAAPGIYDNGFVLPDRGGTASGLTWNWGYDNSSQIVADQLVMTRYDDVPAIGLRDTGLEGIQFGGELVGGFRIGGFQLGKKPVRVNLEGGYAHFTFSQGMMFTSGGTATHTTDGFNLNGITPPEAPYAGTFNGPGPLIDLNSSTHTVVSSPAITTFNGDLDVTLHEVRLGLAFELELTRSLTVGVGVGYSAILSDMDLNYTQSVAFSNPLMPPLATRTAALHRGRWHPGGYAEARFNYRVSKNVGLYLAGTIQSNGDGIVGDATHQVNLDLGGNYSVKFGVSVAF